MKTIRLNLEDFYKTFTRTYNKTKHPTRTFNKMNQYMLNRGQNMSEFFSDVNCPKNMQERHESAAVVLRRHQFKLTPALVKVLKNRSFSDLPMTKSTLAMILRMQHQTHKTEIPQVVESVLMQEFEYHFGIEAGNIFEPIISALKNSLLQTIIDITMTEAILVALGISKCIMSSYTIYRTEGSLRKVAIASLCMDVVATLVPLFNHLKIKTELMELVEESAKYVFGSKETKKEMELKYCEPDLEQLVKENDGLQFPTVNDIDAAIPGGKPQVQTISFVEAKPIDKTVETYDGHIVSELHGTKIVHIADTMFDELDYVPYNSPDLKVPLQSYIEAMEHRSGTVYFSIMFRKRYSSDHMLPQYSKLFRNVLDIDKIPYSRRIEEWVLRHLEEEEQDDALIHFLNVALPDTTETPSERMRQFYALYNNEVYAATYPKRMKIGVVRGGNISAASDDDIARWILNNPTLSYGSDILQGRNISNILHILASKNAEVYKSVKEDVMNSYLVPKTFAADSSTVYFSDGLATHMCFFKAIWPQYFQGSTYIVWPEKDAGPMVGSYQEFEKMVYKELGIKLADYMTHTYDKKLPIQRYWKCKGISVDDIASIANNRPHLSFNVHFAHAQIDDMSGVVYADVDNFTECLYQADEERIKTVKREHICYDILFFQTGVFGPHFVPMVPIPRLEIEINSLTDSLDFSAISDMWPKIAGWLGVLICGIGIGKIMKWIDVDKQVSSTITVLSQLDRADLTLDKLKNYMHKFLTASESPYERNEKSILDLDLKLNKWLTLPHSEYYACPWKIADLTAQINNCQSALTTLTQNVKSPAATILAGTLVAATQLRNEVQRELNTKAVRVVPTVTYIYGDEGVGKTEFGKYFAKKLKEKYGYGDNYLYSFKPSKYFPDYHQQPVGLVDEAFSLKDLAEDQFAIKFNSIVSSDFCNLEGAALSTKVSPCAFEHLIILTNTTPARLMASLPITPEAIPAFAARMKIYKAIYNMGPVEAAKPRTERARMDDYTHMDFIECVPTTTSDTTEFTERNAKMTPNQLFADHCSRMERNIRNYKAITTPTKIEGHSTNHFVVNMNGPPDTGKSELIAQIVQYMSTYSYTSHKLHYPMLQTFTKPGIFIVDDQILVATNGTVDAEREKWYMESFNRLPNGSIILLATNIELKDYKIKFLNGKKALVELTTGHIPVRVKVRKTDIFHNPGTVRRMGYCGYIQDSVGIKEMVTNMELQYKQRGFYDVLTKRNVLPNEIMDLIMTRYKSFKDTYAISQVIKGNPPMPIVPDVEIIGNKTCLEELKSEIRLYQMLSCESGTPNGNKIRVTPEAFDAISKISSVRLAPPFATSYTSESALAVVKHFINIMLPTVPNLRIVLVLEGLPIIKTQGRTIYILEKDDAMSMKTKNIELDKHLVHLEVAGKDMSYNYLQFDYALRNDCIYEKFNDLPISVIGQLKDFIRNAELKYPKVAVQLNKARRSEYMKQLRNNTVSRAHHLWSSCKKHPWLSSLIVFAGSIASLTILIKVLKGNKKKSTSQKIKKQNLHIISDLLHEMIKQDYGISDNDDLQKAIKRAAHIEKESFYDTMNEIYAVESKKGKNKGRAQQGYGKRGTNTMWRQKKYKLPNGEIAYTDERGIIQATYNPVYDAASEVHKGKHIDDAEFAGHTELRWDSEVAHTVRLFHETGNIEPSVITPTIEALQNVDVPMSPDDMVRKQITDNLVHIAYTHQGNAGHYFDETYTVGMGQEMYGIGLSKRYLIAPRHVYAGLGRTDIFVHDARVAAEDQFTPYKWFRAEMVKQYKDYDVALFKIVSKRFPAFKNIQHHLQPAPQERDLLPVTFAMPLRENWNLYHGMMYTLARPQPHVFRDGNTYLTERVGSIEYGCSEFPLTRPGSCGLPYFSYNGKGTKRLVGIHVASNGTKVELDRTYMAVAQLFPPDVLEEWGRIIASDEEKFTFKSEFVSAPLNSNTSEFMLPATFQVVERAKSLWQRGKRQPYMVNPPNGDKYLKIIGATQEYNPPNGKNIYKKTQFSAHVEDLIENTMAPVKFSDFTEQQLADLPLDRNGNPSQLLLQEQKWYDDIGEGMLEPELEHIRLTLQPYFSSLHPNYRVLNEKEILNGLPASAGIGELKALEVNTSIGFEYQARFNVHQKSAVIGVDEATGRRYFKPNKIANVLIEDLKTLDAQVRKRYAPMLLYKNALKIEKLPIEKCHKPRLFTIADIRQVLLERKYLGAFIAANASNEHSHNAVGVTQATFDFIIRNVRSLGGGFDGDYERYDKHLHIHISEISRRLKSNIARLAAGEEAGNAVYAMLTVVHRSIHASANTIYKKEHGLNSGALNTQDDNSDCNFIYIFTAYYNLMPTDLRQKHEFKIIDHFLQHVFLRTYGDDLVAGVHHAVRPWFNLETVSKLLMMKFGMKLNAATKDGTMYKTRKWHELSFISRKFTSFNIPNGSERYVGVLKLNSISGLVHWTVDQSPEQIASQLADCMVEMAYRTKKEYNKIIEVIKIAFKHVPALTSHLTLMSYEDIRVMLYHNLLGLSKPAQIPFKDHLIDVIKNENNFVIESLTNLPTTKTKQIILPKNKSRKELMGFIDACMGCTGAPVECDYVSLLNQLWQKNYISTPLYYDDEKHRTNCVFTDNISHLRCVGIGATGNKRERKQAAAKEGYEIWRDQDVRHSRLASGSTTIESAPTVHLNDLGTTSANAPTNASGGSDSAPPPTSLFSLPAQTAAAPSLLKQGAGEVMASGSAEFEVIELNPDSQPPDIPTASGRPFSIEEYLWNQWIPKNDVLFSSATTKGSLLFKFSANPSNISPLHATYAGLHNKAIFATEHMVYIVGAMNVAGLILIGWVDDDSKATYTVNEVMATSWKTIDVNGNKAMKFCVRDARQSSFFRNIGEKQTMKVPAIVGIALSPLNNMFATSSTYTVNIQIFSRFSKECYFFDPVYEAKTLQSTYRPLGDAAYYLNQSGVSRVQAYVGGNSLPTYKDKVNTSYVGRKKWEAYAEDGEPMTILNIVSVNIPLNSDKTKMVIADGVRAEILVQGTWIAQDEADVVQKIRMTSTSGKALPIFGIFKNSPDGGVTVHDLNTSNAPLNVPVPVAWEYWDKSDTDAYFEYRVGSRSDTREIIDCLTAVCYLNEKTIFEQMDRAEFSCWPMGVPTERPGSSLSKTMSFPAPIGMDDEGHLLSTPFNTLVPLAVAMRLPPNLLSQLRINPAAALGYVSVTSTALSNSLKMFRFIAPAQTTFIADNENTMPIASEVEYNLMKYLNQVMGSAVTCTFDVSSVTGVLFSLGYFRNTGFVINTNQSLRVSPSYSTSSLYVSNVNPGNSVQNIPPNDLSGFNSFVSHLGDAMEERLQAMHIELECAAIMGGIGQGLATAADMWWRSSENAKDRDFSRWRSTGGWQNSLEMIREQGENQRALAQKNFDLTTANSASAVTSGTAAGKPSSLYQSRWTQTMPRPKTIDRSTTMIGRTALSSTRDAWSQVFRPEVTRGAQTPITHTIEDETTKQWKGDAAKTPAAPKQPLPAPSTGTARNTPTKPTQAASENIPMSNITKADTPEGTPRSVPSTSYPGSMTTTTL